MEKLIIDEKAYWQRLKEITIKKNITLKTCCEELGFRYQSILNMHQRGTFPPVNKILQIAFYYETTVEYLAAGITDNISEIRIKELEEQLSKISSIASS
jgi:transcriptional regulator with XRE-family HTH domain